jgi:methionyl-tRNA formyltransferase
VKILFFGTSSISKTYLEELYKSNHEIFVITIPDKPALRGQRLISPAVKVFAIEKKINFIQVEKFTIELIEAVKNFNSDIGIAVAYGKLIPSTVFSLPKNKTFNIHFSLLPKYRGAAPVQYALCNGESETGVTSFYVEKGLDTGDILIQEKISIDVGDNANTLFNKLIPLGVEIMNKTIDLVKKGCVKALPQTGEVSFAPMFKKGAGLVKWNKSAQEIYNLFRGLCMWPGLYSIVSKGKLVGKRIKFINLEVFENNSVNAKTGFIFSLEKNRGFTVSCAFGKVLVTKVQPENKSVMSAWDFIQGGQLTINDSF